MSSVCVVCVVSMSCAGHNREQLMDLIDYSRVEDNEIYYMVWESTFCEGQGTVGCSPWRMSSVKYTGSALRRCDIQRYENCEVSA